MPLCSVREHIHSGCVTGQSVTATQPTITTSPTTSSYEALAVNETVLNTLYQLFHLIYTPLR